MSRPRKKTPAPPPASSYPMMIETFRVPDWALQSMRMDKPSCINFLSYRRYRITAELIEESKEVLAARLQEMWEHADGYGASQRIFNEAMRLGVTLVGEYGSKVAVRQ